MKACHDVLKLKQKISDLESQIVLLKNNNSLSKSCSKCGDEKLLNEYYKTKKAKDGRCAECKSCHNIRMGKYNKTSKAKKLRKQNRIDNYKNIATRQKNVRMLLSKDERMKYDKKRYNKYKDKAMLRKNNNTLMMTDGYIASLLKMNIKDIPIELVELKRIQLKINRELRK